MKTLPIAHFSEKQRTLLLNWLAQYEDFHLLFMERYPEKRDYCPFCDLNKYLSEGNIK